MTNTPTKPPSRPRPVKFDEWIAIFVAFATFGSIFFWATTRENNGFNLLSKPMLSSPLSDTVDSPDIAAEGSIFSLGTPQLKTPNGESASNLDRASLSSEELGTSLATLTPITDTVEKLEANTEDLDRVKTKIERKPKLAQTRETSKKETAPRVAKNLTALGIGKILSESLPTTSPEVKNSPIATETLPVAPPIPTPRKESPQVTETSLPPTTVPSPSGRVKFSDVPNSYWASNFIQSLAERDIITQVNNDKFEPNKPVTRAEFAAQIPKVFEEKSIRKSVNYEDVKADSTAQTEIQRATKSGFLSGYPGNVFRPEQEVSRLQVLVSLASGLNLEIPSNFDEVLSIYKDKEKIPDWAKEKIAAATSAGLVVNHPDVKNLNPNQPATRAEVSAIFYQALVKLGKVKQVSSKYIVSPKKEN
ncbi:MAG: S-layer homology domain-containing protein [Okeania sp. SIO3I5]|uniref:S-layer homology domain-containing protein n=1 Tax=Okeania sp. SIO3I5 TaxID=2607805 RepID=UPI0013BB49C9|nr:S-layer homology domain-containing protein [Okeania sp. SIO3I5]NEQ37749.1 S-layer homology domain-containing protein [Okeania sp. SIO3I5]